MREPAYANAACLRISNHGRFKLNPSSGLRRASPISVRKIYATSAKKLIPTRIKPAV